MCGRDAGDISTAYHRKPLFGFPDTLNVRWGLFPPRDLTNPDSCVIVCDFRKEDTDQRIQGECRTMPARKPYQKMLYLFENGRWLVCHPYGVQWKWKEVNDVVNENQD